MNTTGMLIWLAVQVTFVTAVGSLVCWLARKRSPQFRATFAATTLLATIVLCAGMLAPLPGWFDQSANKNAVDHQLLASNPHVAVTPTSTSATTPGEDITKSPTTLTAEQNAAAESPWLAAWQGFQAGLMQPTPTNAAAPADAASVPVWPRVVLGLYLAGVTFCLLRLLGGWLALRWEIRRSPLVGDEHVRHALATIATEHPLRWEQIRVRETSRLKTAAATGWRRPVILLPAAWRNWTEQELFAVLAHEAAHIRRGDWLTTLASEIGRALHFYHPLVHVLTARLRLDQELAADAVAANSAGGQKPYLRILASMALSQTARPAPWPVRAFLPSRSTFMRRIEMLRDGTLLPHRSRRLFRLGIFAMVAAITMTAAGLRGPRQMAEAQDGPPQVKPAGENAEVVDFSRPKNDLVRFVPSDAAMMFTVDMKALRSNQALKPILTMIAEQEKKSDLRRNPFLLPMDQIDKAVLIAQKFDGPGNKPTFVIQSAADVDRQAILDKLGAEALVERLIDGTHVYHLNDWNQQSLYFEGKRTIVVAGSKQNLGAVIAASRLNRFSAAKQYQAVASAEMTGYLNMDAFRKQMEREMRNGPNDPSSAMILGMVRPLWEKSNSVVYGFGLNGGTLVEAYFDCATEKDAETVAQTITAVTTLAKNMLSMQSTRMKDDFGADGDGGDAAPPELKMAMKAISMTEEMLTTAAVTQDGNQVSLKLTSKDSTAMMISMVLPAVQQAREAARRTQSMNNLKQIALAMHNYHDAYGRFPAPVMVSQHGKKYSWRVALLPFLDQAPLYEQYRMDEDWDSEANKKVLAQIPPTYRSPNDKAGSTNASYFAMVGKNTGFGNTEGEGTRIRDFIDGTSNTLLVVGAKREIPWTKPVDIEIDLTKEKLPKFGGWHQGGFQAALCDGSVRFISESIDQDVLKNLIQRNDGNVVNIP